MVDSDARRPLSPTLKCRRDVLFGVGTDEYKPGLIIIRIYSFNAGE